MRYRILIAGRVKKDLARLHPTDRDRVLRAIANLEDDPRPPGAKALEDMGRLYRIRAGHYRIVYLIDDAETLVRVTRVRHRSDVYR